MIKTHVGIQGVCAWPILQLLPDGKLLVFVFNQPCHGMWEGDVDCWESNDRGESWEWKSRVAAHAPGANRMNVAAGQTSAGEILVVSGGWSHRLSPGQPRSHAEATPLQPIVSRSQDGGSTWQIENGGVPAFDNGNAFVPFGNIRPTADGALGLAVYTRTSGAAYDVKAMAAFLLRSDDQGRTWGQRSTIYGEGNETSILHLGEGRWLASSRYEPNKHIVLCRSEDDGRNWSRGADLTLPNQVTSQLLRLMDGRVLLTYGNRCRNMFGVDARVSKDDGRNWSAPVRLVDCPGWDSGYPSTVQFKDGALATVYYTQISGRYHYEMRVALWDVEELK